MVSIPNLALRGLQVRSSLLSSPPPSNAPSITTKLTSPLPSSTALLLHPHPRPLRPPRRIPSLRRRPLRHKLQRLPRHLAIRDRRHGLSRDGSGCAGRNSWSSS